MWATTKKKRLRLVMVLRAMEMSMLEILLYGYI